MKLSLLGLLACPVCSGELKFSVLEAYPRHDAEVDEAMLTCKLCAKDYPVTDGVPRLSHPDGAAPAAGEKDDGRPRAGDTERFLEDSLLTAQELSGKLLLDAGCGSGRSCVAALSLDAEVVAVDGAGNMERVIELAKTRPKLHPVEGDAFRPPLKKASFDAVYSRGLLQRSGDASAAFGALAALVKPRGFLSVWLRGEAGSYADYATNPLREDCGGLARRRRLAWLAASVASFFGGGRHTKEELQAWCAREGFSIVAARAHALLPEPGVLARRGS